MAEAIIDVHELNKSYGHTHVLRGVNLQVPRGAIVGLMGTNGSGKSTLIKCLLGLLRADAGTMHLMGSDSWDLAPAVKERLGYVPQVVYLYNWMKVRHVIAYTASFYERWDDAWAEELAHRWRLPLDAQRANAFDRPVASRGAGAGAGAQAGSTDPRRAGGQP